MSVVSNHTTTQGLTIQLSEIEYVLMLNSQAQFSLINQTRDAIGNEELLEQLHELSRQLELEQKQLEAEYNVMKTMLEGFRKMKTASIKRTFDIDV